MSGDKWIRCRRILFSAFRKGAGLRIEVPTAYNRQKDISVREKGNDSSLLVLSWGYFNATRYRTKKKVIKHYKLNSKTVRHVPHSVLFTCKMFCIPLIDKMECSLSIVSINKQRQNKKTRNWNERVIEYHFRR